MKITMLVVFSTLLGTAFASVVESAVRSVVLVHGSFADGSGWKSVADILKQDGYTVEVVQEPLTGLAGDVVATRLVLDRAGPCVLVGHSWGGMIITEAGVHPSVRSLVYVNAFQPEVGETAGGLQAKTPPASNNVVSVGGGFVQEKPESFPADFASDVPKPLAEFMAILPSTNRCRQLFGEDDRRGVVSETQLRRGLPAGSNDQSRTRTIHGRSSEVPDDRASRQSRHISVTSQRNSRANRKGGESGELNVDTFVQWTLSARICDARAGEW
jgi:pimeloyl-ACP methyl ester carboxylesterase